MIHLLDVYRDDYVDQPDIEFLYKLLAERKVSESISHKRMPSFDEHDSFVRSRPYLGWYLICDDDGERLGTCYITKYREVGIWLLPKAAGKGAGQAAIGQLLDMYPGRVYTNTSIFNDGAFKFYSKCGFRYCANMLEHDNNGPAGSSYSSSAFKLIEATQKGPSGDSWHSSARLDAESSEICGND